jgi:transposase InsO family protein
VELLKHHADSGGPLLKYHANARLTLRARRELVERMQAGWGAGDIGDQMGVSTATVYKWWRRWRTEGDAGLWDRSSRPRSSPKQTSSAMERRIERIRSTRKLGPARIAGIVEMHPSTVHRVLARQGLSRLALMDQPTGRVIRRIHTSRPGELVHVDTKKLHQVPVGGGWRAHGRGVVAQRDRPTPQLDYIHTVIDAYSRVAYVEVWPDDQAVTCVGVFERAIAWFAERGVTIEAVLSDNGPGYISNAWRDLCGEHHIDARRIRAYTPRTNGKVERFNRTLQAEWAYVRLYRSNGQRLAALARWLHTYNHHRCHTSLDGQPPMSRLNNLPGHYT